MITWLGKKSKPRLPVFQRQNVQHAFLMPSYCAEDVQVGIRTGSIISTTELTLCENDSDRMYTLRTVFWPQICPKNFPKPRFERDNFANIHLRKPVDLSWIDADGNLDFASFEWVRNHLTKFILPNADMAFTLNFRSRGNPLIPDLIEFCNDNPCNYLESIRKQLSSKTDSNHVPIAIAHIVMLDYLFGDYNYKLEFYPYDSVEDNKWYVGKHILYILRALNKGNSPMPIDFKIKIKALVFRWLLTKRLKIEGLATKNTKSAIKAEANKLFRLCVGEKVSLSLTASTITNPTILPDLVRCSLSRI